SGERRQLRAQPAGRDRAGAGQGRRGRNRSAAEFDLAAGRAGQRTVREKCGQPAQAGDRRRGGETGLDRRDSVGRRGVERVAMETAMVGFIALYIVMLAAFTGIEIIGRVPAILHTPLMSGSNFVHGIVVVGALYALLTAANPAQQIIGFVGVLLGAGNAAGGYVVTKRMLEMFKSSGGGGH